MKENAVKNKSLEFAVEIVNLYKLIVEQKKEYVMTRQLLKSGTSIGANIREAEQAQSPADFVHKLSISLKEANETEYWLELLYITKFIEENSFKNINIKCDELKRLLTAIIKTSKDKIKK
jgi:four helix bundle protein